MNREAREKANRCTHGSCTNVATGRYLTRYDHFFAWDGSYCDDCADSERRHAKAMRAAFVKLPDVGSEECLSVEVMCHAFAGLAVYR